MIDIDRAKNVFNNFLNKYSVQNELGFELKVVHTYHVVNVTKEITYKLNLQEEDIKLAELIALLHDIGRFEEINILKKFDSINFDHAFYGVDMLFKDNLIRLFIEDESYDEIIKTAIYNHNKLSIQEGLDDRTLLHCKIIRDADKLDNFRVKKEEKIEAIFPGILNCIEDIENSKLSDEVYDSIKNRKSVDIHDRKTVLDYWVCVLAFVFDLNFKESYQIVKDNNYINILIDRFNYKDQATKYMMEDIRKILNEYVDLMIKNKN